MRTIAQISAVEAGWLALHIRKQNEATRELVGEEIARELKVRLSLAAPLYDQQLKFLFPACRRRVLHATSGHSASSSSKTRAHFVGQRTALRN
jgi:hypothetical protein